MNKLREWGNNIGLFLNEVGIWLGANDKYADWMMFSLISIIVVILSSIVVTSILLSVTEKVTRKKLETEHEYLMENGHCCPNCTKLINELRHVKRVRDDK